MHLALDTAWQHSLCDMAAGEAKNVQQLPWGCRAGRTPVGQLIAGGGQGCLLPAGACGLVVKKFTSGGLVHVWSSVSSSEGWRPRCAAVPWMRGVQAPRRRVTGSVVCFFHHPCRGVRQAAKQQRIKTDE